ncbi:cell division protein FtsA [Candidatus Shapirobacteria bacterium]|nr:cell division protein FtsA [Candidatus Shapirobacteria bacterium]
MQHSKIICGIDIGTSKVTTIVGQFFEVEDRFNVIAVASTPASGFRKGQIINLDQATQTITQSIESAERMAGFQLKSAHVSISAPHIESVNSQGVVAVSTPNGEITHGDITRVIEAAQAVTLPAGKELIHTIPRRYTVDGQEGVIDPIGMNGVRLELESHLILASSPSLKNLYKCLEEVGIDTDSLVFSGLATAKAALTNTEKELGVALIDIGGSVTSLTIYTEGSPVYSSVIPVGANNVTNDLAIGLRLSIEDADKIKLKINKIVEAKKLEDDVDLSVFGILSEEKHKISLQTAVNGIIKPRLEELFTLIYDQIETSGFSALIPAGVVITGGGAQTINAKDICSKVIPLPLRVASPPKLGGIVDDILNPSYTSSIGLLMYGLEQTTQSGNSNKKNKTNVSGLFNKIKSLIEPLLP